MKIKKNHENKSSLSSSKHIQNLYNRPNQKKLIITEQKKYTFVSSRSEVRSISLIIGIKFFYLWNDTVTATSICQMTNSQNPKGLDQLRISGGLSSINEYIKEIKSVTGAQAINNSALSAKQIKRMNKDNKIGAD